LGLWVVDLRSPAVMSVIQVFPSYVMLSLACVFVRVFGLPSLMMWDDHGEDRCCDLSKVGIVETVGFRQVMWLVMLGSAKDRILGVDPLGQHVPPRVRYGTPCLLISYAIGCVSCSVEWRWLLSLWPIFVTCLCDILCELHEPHGAKEATLCGKPQHCKRGHFVWEFVAKHDILL
jgi:hypothetical protein